MKTLDKAIERYYQKAKELRDANLDDKEFWQLAQWLEELKARQDGEYITQGDILRRMNNEQLARELQNIHADGALHAERVINTGYRQHAKEWRDWVNHRMTIKKNTEEKKK